MLFGNGLLPALRAASCTPCVNKTPKFYFQNETSQLVPVVVESVSCLFLLSPFCLISLFRVVTCFQTVAVKSSYISVIDCNDFMMSTEFRLQWWVGGFVTHLRVACCPMRGAYWISGGALQKGKKATEPLVQFDNRFLWVAGFSFCIGVICGACMLVTVIFLYFLWSA